jgi:hypothetical protein
MACQEMELYFAYLDALEEEKRKAQPWQCEVTVIAQADDAAAGPKPMPKPAARSKPSFVCDDPE